MRRIKNIIKLFIIGLVFLNVWKFKDSGENFHAFSDDHYESQYVYVLNRDNKETVIRKNDQIRAYPASLTKMMTTLVALEQIDDLSALAPVDKESYQEMVRENASMAGFYSNEATTYRDLLYGTILSSGGEAANSLAINLAGSQEAFVEQMNQKAKEIGLENTHFMNPEGFDHKRQYTTAADMAKLLDYALDNGDFRAIFTKEIFQSSPTVDHPDGVMLESTVLSKISSEVQLGYEILGGKSGTTLQSGQSWITLGEKEGAEYIVVTMGAKIDKKRGQKDRQIVDTLAIFEQL